VGRLRRRRLSLRFSSSLFVIGKIRHHNRNRAAPLALRGQLAEGGPEIGDRALNRLWICEV
jgi:hypothetical protein